MSQFAPFAAAYRFFARRRLLFYGLTAAAVGVTALLSLRVKTDENIETMLPDRDPGLALDFQLLKRSPLARKLIIHLERQPQVSQEDLLAAIDQLAAALPAPYFRRVLTGPGKGFGGGFFTWLIGALPNLATAADMREVAAGLTADQVRTQLEAARRTLTAPEGMAMKELETYCGEWLGGPWPESHSPQ